MGRLAYCVWFKGYWIKILRGMRSGETVFVLCRLYVLRSPAPGAGILENSIDLVQWSLGGL